MEKIFLALQSRCWCRVIEIHYFSLRCRVIISLFSFGVAAVAVELDSDRCSAREQMLKFDRRKSFFFLN